VITKTVEYIKWAVNAIVDMYSTNMLSPGDVTVSLMDGAHAWFHALSDCVISRESFFDRSPLPIACAAIAGSRSGGKGLAHLLMLKYDILMYMTGPFLAAKSFDENTRPSAESRLTQSGVPGCFGCGIARLTHIVS